MANLFIKSTTRDKIHFFADNIKKFHIVTDFDGTLNYLYTPRWERVQSVISLIYNNQILGHDYMKKAQDLYNKFIPFELDTSLSADIRIKAMESWAQEHKKLLMHYQLSQKNLQEIIALQKIKMRHWVDDFLRFLNRLDIPCVVFSASEIGVDAIPLVFADWWLDDIDYTIVSNSLQRNDKGIMIGYEDPSIHPLNKTESIIGQCELFEDSRKAIADRPHAIVIGDNVHDADMVDDSDNRVIIRVGFYNDLDDGRREDFKERFDIVITQDGDFDVLNSLLGIKKSFPLSIMMN